MSGAFGNPGPPGTAELESIDTDTTALAGVLRTSPGTASDTGLGAHILSAPLLITQPAPSFAASAPTAGNATPNGTYIYIAGVDRENVGAEVDNWALVSKAYQGGDWIVLQGPGDPGRVWYVRGTNELDEPERLATEASLVTIAAVSDGNSSTVALGANAEFVGAWVEILQFVELRIAVRSDVPSAEAGLVIEQSHDGVTVIADDSYAVMANQKATFVAQRAAKYARVRYLNGVAPQTTFALQTILSRHPAIHSVHNVGHIEELDIEDDAALAISLLIGSAPGGGYRSARVDEYRRLRIVSPQDSSPLSTVATGRTDVSTTVETLIVSPPYNEQTTGAQRSVVSTSAQDGVGGIGIRSVVLEYYRDDLTGPFFETIVLNGLTAVNTVATDICYIERFYGLTAGSPLATAVGDISLKSSVGGGGVTMWTIPIGDRKARGAHHYLSPGADVRVTQVVAGVTGTGPASIYLLFAQILTSNYMYEQFGPTLRVSDNGQAVMPQSSVMRYIGPGKLVMAVRRDSAPAIMTYSGAFFYYHNTDT